MRWNDKVSPDVGTKRTVVKFAYLPVTILGHNRWLERVAITQEWREGGAADVVFKGWVDIKFDDVWLCRWKDTRKSR